MALSDKILGLALDMANRCEWDAVSRLEALHFEARRLEEGLAALVKERTDATIAPEVIFRQIAGRQGAGTRHPKSSIRRLSDGE